MTKDEDLNAEELEAFMRDPGGAWEETKLSTDAWLGSIAATIAQLQADKAEAQAIVAECNNSLFGSHGYFTDASGVTAEQAIENLKADNGRAFRANEKLEDAAVFAIKRAESAEAQLACVVEALKPFAQLGALSAFHGDGYVRLRTGDDAKGTAINMKCFRDANDVLCHLPTAAAALMERVKRAEDLCDDCPPSGYPIDKTRCGPCPIKRAASEG